MALTHEAANFPINPPTVALHSAVAGYRKRSADHHVYGGPVTEFHGKRRKHKAYITVSCSGPDLPTTRSGTFGTRCSRASADLRFTTADCDWFYAHLTAPDDDTGMAEEHFRLVNPSRADLFEAITAAGKFLSQHVGAPEWDGGQTTFVYAGHGAPSTGAWVLKDGEVTAQELAGRVAAAIDQRRRRCRIDLICDSCFAGAFFADLLAYCWGPASDRLFPCEAVGAALSDEEAWEYPSFGHGVFTYAFKAMFEPLMLGQPSLPRHPRIGIRDTDRLRSGGVSWLTDDEQHAFEYTNGHLEVIGGGHANLHSRESLSSAEIQRVMAKALNTMPGDEIHVP